MSADAMGEIDDVAARYARFAADEAPGRSALYEEWAAGVAGDRGVAEILARIPATHRQPPLVFAVTRLLGAPESGFGEWAQWLSVHADDVVADASARSVQTNEPLRCAALLPALSTIDGPIALVELGASAGLCLFPDRYSYRYRGGPSLDPADGASTVVLACDVTGDPPLRLPDIVWRAGVDLAPLDAADPNDRRFLTTLVWPGETGRAERIDAALDIVAAARPFLVAGDASDPEVLRSVVDTAPRDATLVVTTPGLLPHVPRAGRERLAAQLSGLDGVWISIDPPGLLGAGQSGPGFVLTRDGVPLASVDPLGASVEWRAGREGHRG